MPFAINEGVRIFYEVEGDGEVDGKSETLVMIDGFSTPLDMWREEGYTAAMSGGRRLVLIDVRGHGQSDKPHLPADYRPELLVGDVLAVLDQFGEKTAHYLGASMGAAIGFEIARRAPERLRSLTLLGYGKYGSPTELQRRFQAMGRQMEEAAVVMGAEPAWTTVERAVGPRPAKDRDTGSSPTTTRRFSRSSWPWTSGRDSRTPSQGSPLPPSSSSPKGIPSTWRRGSAPI